VKPLTKLGLIFFILEDKDLIGLVEKFLDCEDPLNLQELGCLNKQQPLLPIFTTVW
jgi:hypothetical protein